MHEVPVERRLKPASVQRFLDVGRRLLCSPCGPAEVDAYPENDEDDGKDCR